MRPRPKYWPQGQFGLEALTSLHWGTRFLHRCRSLAALLTPCQVRFILCRSSLNDVRQVICGRPLVLWPDSGIQVMATCAGLTSGNRSSSNIYCLRIEILAERIVDHELNEYYNLIAQMLD